MQLLKFKSTEMTTIVRGEVVKNKQYGGIKHIYELFTFGTPISIFGVVLYYKNRKKISDVIFLKPLMEYAPKTKEDRKNRANLLSSRWLILNKDFQDIEQDLINIRIIKIVEDKKLAKNLNHLLPEIFIADNIF